MSELTDSAQNQNQKSGERLAALHSRLQQEAEKIRKWKNATEVELKEKACEYFAVHTMSVCCVG